MGVPNIPHPLKINVRMQIFEKFFRIQVQDQQIYLYSDFQVEILSGES